MEVCTSRAYPRPTTGTCLTTTGPSSPKATSSAGPFKITACSSGAPGETLLHHLLEGTLHPPVTGHRRVDDHTGPTAPLTRRNRHRFGRAGKTSGTLLQHNLRRPAVSSGHRRNPKTAPTEAP
ncbi:hypothetical protein [Streptomyces yaizuensis]|uniref:Uncharacterized protein n=1 Tax=Streptomyces yaizuensis TaxID=2989713 RepID=A0ABQ5P6W5_9ACTN|nr:hypothetical protein [Streptomyces sp. YSPA8]GLF98228.1 hypothetical protein SYYSPA8_28045 [Streptomyces sp. YSPA8]